MRPAFVDVEVSATLIPAGHVTGGVDDARTHLALPVTPLRTSGLRASGAASVFGPGRVCFILAVNQRESDQIDNP